MTMKLPCILLGTIAVTATITSAKAQTLGYEFDDLTLGLLAGGESVFNAGSVGGAGTFQNGTAGGSATVVNTGTVTGTACGDVMLGYTLTLSPADIANQNLEAPNINANASAGMFGFALNQTYSAFAWVNMLNAPNADPSLGDNMIFGGDGLIANGGTGEVLHLGTRNGNVQSGHWADDVGPDQGLNIPVPANEWHVLAYTNDGVTGIQTIYMDPGSPGEQVMSGGAGFGDPLVLHMDTAINLLIGTANNAGSFNGQLDRVTAYDTLRTPAELAAAATVPEPATLVALASGAGLLLMGRRRRRSA